MSCEHPTTQQTERGQEGSNLRTAVPEKAPCSFFLITLLISSDRGARSVEFNRVKVAETTERERVNEVNEAQKRELEEVSIIGF